MVHTPKKTSLLKSQIKAASNEVKCPECGTPFTLDARHAADLRQQVRDREFEADLEQRVQASVALAKAEFELAAEKKIAEKDSEIQLLQGKLNSADTAREAAVLKAVDPLNKSNSLLEKKLVRAESDAAIQLKDLKAKHKSELDEKDEEIRNIREMAARRSTKAVGEDLEEYCRNKVEMLRPLMPYASFKKDTTGSSRGDYIFRNFDENGFEYVSILFEMKNESEDSKSRKKNDVFLPKLNADRNSKMCTYAVLVSTLEADNDLYNSGPVSKCHEYPDTYVIRPQHIVAMISLLSELGKRSLPLQAELEEARQQSLDISSFLRNLQEAKESVSLTLGKCISRPENMIASIERIISALEKVKSQLLVMQKDFRAADAKLKILSASRLTKDSPLIAQEIAHLKNGSA